MIDSETMDKTAPASDIDRKDPAPVERVASTLNPERPIAALRVGITGHRQMRLADGEIDRIRQEIVTALRLVREEVETLVEGHKWAFADAPALLQCISPLADGADMLAAETALEEGYQLLAPLPFPREQYREDFSEEGREKLQALLSRARAVIEFDNVPNGNAEAHSLAYLRAGILTIAQSDIMIAVWDGEDARGVGGTAMIKDKAVEVGKPVIWINSDRVKATRMLNADAADESLRDGVRRAIARVLAPPAVDDIGYEISGTHTGARKAYRNYLSEKAQTVNFGIFYQLIERTIVGQSVLGLKFTSPSLEARMAEETRSPIVEAAPPSETTRKILDGLIAPRFAWADLLATHYGALYRSSYFFNYLFSAAAVLLALMSLIVTAVGKPFWIGLEVAVILAVLFVTLRGRRGRWHEKWIDYRHLAEELRHFRRVYLSVGSGYDPGQDDREVSGGWVDWYLRATVREAGLADIRFTPARIKSAARAIVDADLRPQIAYHKKKSKTLHKIEHRLHRLGEAAFGATLLVCVAYLAAAGLVSADFGAAAPGGGHQAFSGGADAAYESGEGGFGGWLETSGKYWVTVLTGFLPAFGAAIFGIRVQGEFGSTSERSHATADDLDLICKQFEAIADAPSPRLAALQDCLDNAGRVILAENKDWRILYISKPLNLPG